MSAKMFTPIILGLQVSISIIVLFLEVNLSESNPTPFDSCVRLDGRQTCHSTDANPYRKYGSKTPYPAVFKDYTKHYDLQGCTPKVFYMLSRHATRYPDVEYIQYIHDHLPTLKEKIISSYERGAAKLCEEDINNLKTWVPTMTPKDENMLSTTGAMEAEELGERMRQRFPDILDMKYSPDRFTIEYTSKIRTEHTAKNFSRGLFTEQDYEKINFKGKANDKLLRYHKECKKMMNKCKNPKVEVKEYEKFANGSLMQKTLQSVSNRLGFRITNDDLLHMHIACTFGHALEIGDAWCAVFTEDELKVMEYLDDLQDYYKRSYGNVINPEQACPLIKYIKDLFKSYEKNKRNKVVLQFTHGGALTRFFSSLGIFRDDHKLTAEDFCVSERRKWRTTDVVPFNTNIAFVLYDCEGVAKFMTLHNEKPVAIDGCESHKLCSLRNFYEKYDSVTNRCDLHEICGKCN